MARSLLILGAILLTLPATGWPQQVDTTLVTPDFNKLKTPESPAFEILGLSPSTVSRPTSPKAFALSFLDNLRSQERFSLIPRDFAVEVNPYWWSTHPGLSLEEYRAGGIKSLYRTFTLSLATADSTIQSPVGDQSFRRLGVGVRSLLYTGQETPACVGTILEAVRPFTDRLAKIIADSIESDPTLARNAERLAQISEAERQRLIAQDLEALSQENRQRCTDAIADRKGFVMSIAGAAAFGFLEGDPAAVVPTPEADLSSVGFWVTPSYLSGSFSGIGVIRTVWKQLEADTTEFAFEFGGRLIFSADRYAASAEGLYRRRNRGDDSMNEYRLAAVLDVRLSSDLWLTATFGKEFDQEEGSGLIALANLQWSFGKPAARPVPSHEGSQGGG